MSVYKILETISNMTIGGWLSIFVVLSLFVEIAPIRINPIGWLGKRLNAFMDKRVDKIERKLDEHIAQSYRTKVLAFQDSLLTQGYTKFTKEQYDEVLLAITDYEDYCEENNISNDKCVLAIKYIKRCYEKCQNGRSFSNLPVDLN